MKSSASLPTQKVAMGIKNLSAYHPLFYSGDIFLSLFNSQNPEINIGTILLTLVRPYLSYSTEFFF